MPVAWLKHSVAASDGGGLLGPRDLAAQQQGPGGRQRVDRETAALGPSYWQRVGAGRAPLQPCPPITLPPQTTSVSVKPRLRREAAVPCLLSSLATSLPSRLRNQDRADWLQPPHLPPRPGRLPCRVDYLHSPWIRKCRFTGPRKGQENQVNQEVQHLSATWSMHLMAPSSPGMVTPCSPCQHHRLAGPSVTDSLSH